MLVHRDLKIGLVCYWQDGGWHGCHIITRWNKKFVYTKNYPSKKNEKEHRFALSKFLDDHECFNHLCEYGSYHKNIGKVVTI